MIASNPQARVLAALLGVALGVLGFALIPVYNAPFVGCATSPWLTLAPGCSVWPEIARGSALLLPIALLTPRKWKIPLVAVAALFALSLAGGIGGILVGDHLSLASWSDIYFAFLLGYPSLLGGVIVLLAWAFAPLIKPDDRGQPASKPAP